MPEIQGTISAKVVFTSGLFLLKILINVHLCDLCVTYNRWHTRDEMKCIAKHFIVIEEKVQLQGSRVIWQYIGNVLYWTFPFFNMKVMQRTLWSISCTAWELPSRKMKNPARKFLNQRSLERSLLLMGENTVRQFDSNLLNPKKMEIWWTKEKSVIYYSYFFLILSSVCILK